MGPFAGFAENAEHMLRVLGMHRAEAAEIDEELVPPSCCGAAQRVVGRRRSSWPTTYGVRNSQASVLAPTGTIGLLMDCDTTGIEPDLGLCKMKKLVGGGTMSIVNQTVPRALRRLGYTAEQIDEIVAYIDEHKTILGAPHLAAEHVPVFACSMGDNAIHYLGPRADDGGGPAVHLRRHLQDGEHARGGHRRGRRAAAHRRLAARPQGRRHLPRQLQGGPAPVARPRRSRRRVVAPAPRGAGRGAGRRAGRSASPKREKLPRNRRSRTFEFRVADCKGFVTVGEYDDGRPGEVFLRVSKQGSTLAGIMDAFAISVSHGLQYGVPLKAFVEAFTNMRFEPAGMTDDPDIRFASSLVDYIFRRLAVDYLPLDERMELGILSVGERMQPTLPGVEEATTTTASSFDVQVAPPAENTASLDLGAVAPAARPCRRPSTVTDHRRDVPAGAADAPMCMQCGVQMQRAGTCHACPSCGSTSGCS